MQRPRYDDTAIDRLIWQVIQDSQCPDDFRNYLDHRPENAAHLDEALDRLVELDDADAAFAEGQRCYPAAVAAIEVLANAGDATAQFHMGKVLDNGLGMPPDMGRGIAWYRLAILQGELRSHVNLAAILLTGDATAADRAEAHSLYEKAAERGEPLALFHLARLAGGDLQGRADQLRVFEMLHAAWEAGDATAGDWIGNKLLAGIAKDGAQAVALLKPGALRGDPYAQRMLGLAYLWGIDVVKNARFGRKWLARAADGGDADACYQLGRLMAGGEAADLAAAARLYEKAARIGSSEAQAALGVCYWTGRGVAADAHAAYKWIHLASLQGDPWGLHLLGRLYYTGIGVPVDYAAAARCFMRSATRGHAPAQAKLGWCYLTGKGVHRDVAEGMVWLQRAIQQGHAEASTTVGYVLRDGVGVTANAAEASEWFLDAAEKGDAAGQRELALLYAEGRGLRQDPDEARRWMEKAAAQGDEEAQTWLVKTGAEAACVFAVSPAPTLA